MANCLVCDVSNRDGARFCADCGTPLPRMADPASTDAETFVSSRNPSVQEAAGLPPLPSPPRQPPPQQAPQFGGAPASWPMSAPASSAAPSHMATPNVGKSVSGFSRVVVILLTLLSAVTSLAVASLFESRDPSTGAVNAISWMARVTPAAFPWKFWKYFGEVDGTTKAQIVVIVATLLLLVAAFFAVVVDSRPVTVAFSSLVAFGLATHAAFLANDFRKGYSYLRWTRLQDRLLPIGATLFGALLMLLAALLAGGRRNTAT